MLAYSTLLGTIVAEELFWVIAAVVVAVVFGVVTIWATLRSRPRPGLAYETQATPLIAAEAAASRLEIRFDGRPVNQVHLVELTVANIGNTAFAASDFVEALHVVLPQGASPLSAEVTDVKPDDLDPLVEIDDELGATARLALLNPRDGFTMAVLVEGLQDPDAVRLGGRVAGVHDFRRSMESNAAKLAKITVRAAPLGLELSAGPRTSSRRA